MTISELIQKITDSVLSEEAKQKIIVLAQGYSEVTPELEEEVKSLIQEDIDKDLAELGADETDPEIEAAEAKLHEELDGIEAELESGLAEVDQDLAELDQMRADISTAEEAYKIAQLRSDLTVGS